MCRWWVLRQRTRAARRCRSTSIVMDPRITLTICYPQDAACDDVSQMLPLQSHTLLEIRCLERSESSLSTTLKTETQDTKRIHRLRDYMASQTQPSPVPIRKAVTNLPHCQTENRLTSSDDNPSIPVPFFTRRGPIQPRKGSISCLRSSRNKPENQVERTC